MSFQQGLSGLNAAAAHLDTIGNNVANTSTVGFKESVAQFADVFAASLSGAGSNSIGIGVKVADVAQQFSQGNITATSNALDVAINGQRPVPAGPERRDRATRAAGSFRFDSQGFIVNNAGLNLTGFGVDTNGVILSAAPARSRSPLPTSVRRPPASSRSG
jgi:flagellar hook protein FlgE